MQYIRAIRSFLVISNLGCCGVNRRCVGATGKQAALFARFDRDVGKWRFDQNSKYRVNKNDEEIFFRVRPSCVIPGGSKTPPESRDFRFRSLSSGGAKRRPVGPSRNDGV
jgi:hypothetical protein